MVTLVLTACPAGLRGHLTRWLEEVAPGVFVGRVNPRLREALWGLVMEMVNNGRALMVYPDDSMEKGYVCRTHRHEWQPRDFDGLVLLERPDRRAGETLGRGWSRAYQRRRGRRSR